MSLSPSQLRLLYVIYKYIPRVLSRFDFSRPPRSRRQGPLKPAGLIDAISGVFVHAGRRELPVVVSCRGQLRPYLIGDYSLESDSAAFDPSLACPATVP